MNNPDSLKVSRYRPLQEAVDEVERELNVRSRCFPRWITDGRVSRSDACDRLDRLATAFLWLNAVLSAAPELQATIMPKDVTSSGDLPAEAKPF
jgi:hypothetical protein